MNNQVLGSPDAVVTGANLSQIIYRDNLYYDHSVFNVPPTTGITSQITPAATIPTSEAPARRPESIHHSDYHHTKLARTWRDGYVFHALRHRDI